MVVLLVLASCSKKDYVCSCRIQYLMNVKSDSYSSFEIKHKTKIKADRDCEKYQSNWVLLNDSSININCELQ